LLAAAGVEIEVDPAEIDENRLRPSGRKHERRPIVPSRLLRPKRAVSRRATMARS
jgi:hypothetical protein